MSAARALNRLVGEALVNERLCRDLLNGRRAELLSSIQLGPEQTAAVLSIQATTLQEFAQAVEQVMENHSMANAHSEAARGGGGTAPGPEPGPSF